jgi:transcriptional regulator with XRE-family HTH domain
VGGTHVMKTGEFLQNAREARGISRTRLAREMAYPGSAIKGIEEGTRIPQPATVQAILDTLDRIGRGETRFDEDGYPLPGKDGEGLWRRD